MLDDLIQSKKLSGKNHDVLLYKLDHYGIRGSIKEWFSSYLSGREQYVDFNGSHSNRLPILTGVPQGSILGPLLFLLYINDLPSASNLKCTLYADDSNLLLRGPNIQQTALALNVQLDRVNDYFKANKLKLNTKKTKLVCFHKKNQTINYSDFPIFLDGDELKYEDEASFLGLTIDCHLNWESHCQKVANKISANNGVLNRVKKLLPPTALKTLYNSLILPHLNYGLAAWGGCSGQAKNRIILTQKRAIRTVSKAFYTSHTEPRMKQLGLLKFVDLYELQCATLAHDVINKRAPASICSMISADRDLVSHNLRSHQIDPNHLRVPLAKSKFISSSFIHKGPSIWNQLPNDLKVLQSKSLFKIHVKRWFLSKYHDSTQCLNPRCTDRRHHHQ